MVLQFDLLTFVCVCVCVYGMQRKRLTLLMAAALFQGASVGPLIDLAIQIDPRYAFITFLVCHALGYFIFIGASIDRVVIQSIVEGIPIFIYSI
jgi:hypothetical protein